MFGQANTLCVTKTTERNYKAPKSKRHNETVERWPQGQQCHEAPGETSSKLGRLFQNKVRRLPRQLATCLLRLDGVVTVMLAAVLVYNVNQYSTNMEELKYREDKMRKMELMHQKERHKLERESELKYQQHMENMELQMKQIKLKHQQELEQLIQERELQHKEEKEKILQTERTEKVKHLHELEKINGEQQRELEQLEQKKKHREAKELQRLQHQMEERELQMNEIHRICQERTKPRLETKRRWFKKRETWIMPAETFTQCTDSLKRVMSIIN